MADPNAPPPRDKTKDPRAVANIKKAMADPKIMEEVRRATREILEGMPTSTRDRQCADHDAQNAATQNQVKEIRQSQAKKT